MGALAPPPEGEWRRLTTGGVVQVDWCWHCNACPARLTQDPMVRDAIGVCASCASQRTGVMRRRGLL